MPLTDASELLTTKLALPRTQSGPVMRAQLWTRLDKGLERKLTLIAAPPGFGKTTLVSAWAAARPEPVAWVSLDAGDNDPVRFWRYVLTACRAFDPALGKEALAALRASPTPAFEGALTSFVNELSRLDTRVILVLDDYHVITSREVHDTLSFLIDHFPAPLHLILITRSEPPLPLARLRARNELSELEAADLRFSTEEIRALFQQTLQLSLSAESVARLEARTEGWAAGLRLLTLALEGKHEPADAERLFATFTGQDRRVLDYMVGEVLAGQPEWIQEFLLQTSFLNRLTGLLCDAVTGRSDSARVLEQLARANLFLIPLGTPGEEPWYRYHRLFAEAMHHQARRRFGDADLQARYDRAAVWYQDHGLYADAIESSLAAQSYERAAKWMEQYQERRGAFEIYTFQRWIEQLPKAVLERHPDLCFTEAMALLFTSDRYLPATAPRVEVPLRAAEQTWRREKNAPKLGQVLSLRGIMTLWQGELQRGFALARESLQLLPEDDAQWRASSLLAVGLEEMLAGKTNSAQRLLIEARALSGVAQNIHGVLAALSILGETYIWQAEFEQADQLYRQVLSEAVGGEAMLDDQSSAHLGLGRIAIERNSLAQAEPHASRAVELAIQRADEQNRVAASLVLARVEHAHGKTAQAQERLRELVVQTRQPRLLREIRVWQARFALDAGDLETIQHWSTTYEPNHDDTPRILQAEEAMLLARLHLAEGRPEAALELLEPWCSDAHANGRTLGELRVLALQALAYFAQSDLDRARKTLIRALTLAQPKDCPRVFLDEGEPMRSMISDFRSEIGKRTPRLRVYTYKLLSAFSSHVSAPAMKSEFINLKSQIPFEPLSPQEQRVLHLLAAGLSNPEIARELVVSTNTIKTQLQSIYRKLNVNNREEAREMARELKLV